MPLFLTAIALVAGWQSVVSSVSRSDMVSAAVIHTDEETTFTSLGASLLAGQEAVLSRTKESDTLIEGEALFNTRTLSKFVVSDTGEVWILAGAAYALVSDDSTIVAALDAPLLLCVRGKHECSLVPRGYQSTLHADGVGALLPLPESWIERQMERVHTSSVSENDVSRLPKELRATLTRHDDDALHLAWEQHRADMSTDDLRILLAAALARPSKNVSHALLVSRLADAIAPSIPLDILVLLSLSKTRSISAKNPLFDTVNIGNVSPESLSLAISSEAQHSASRMPEELVASWTQWTRQAMTENDIDIERLLSPALALIPQLEKAGFLLSAQLWQNALDTIHTYGTAVGSDDQKRVLNKLFSKPSMQKEAHGSPEQTTENNTALIPVARQMISEAGGMFTAVDTMLTNTEDSIVHASHVYFPIDGKDRSLDFDLDVKTGIASTISIDGVLMPNEMPIMQLSR